MVRTLHRTPGQKSAIFPRLGIQSGKSLPIAFMLSCHIQTLGCNPSDISHPLNTIIYFVRIAICYAQCKEDVISSNGNIINICILAINHKSLNDVWCEQVSLLANLRITAPPRTRALRSRGWGGVADFWGVVMTWPIILLAWNSFGGIRYPRRVHLDVLGFLRI